MMQSSTSSDIMVDFFDATMDDLLATLKESEKLGSKAEVAPWFKKTPEGYRIGIVVQDSVRGRIDIDMGLGSISMEGAKEIADMFMGYYQRFVDKEAASPLIN